MSKSGKLSKTQRQFPEEATIVGPPPDVEPTLVGAPLGWAPEPEQPTAVQVEAPIPPPAATEAPSEPVAEPRPAVEVEVRTVKNPATLARRQLPTYELWTKNRVYNLDATMSCIEVIDLASGRTDKKHTLLGAQLVGGQMRTPDGNELSYPLPTPGSDAVFQKLDNKGRVRLVMTSKVTRVILHVQLVRVIADESEMTWDHIASTRHGAWPEPGHQ